MNAAVQRLQEAIFGVGQEFMKLKMCQAKHDPLKTQLSPPQPTHLLIYWNIIQTAQSASVFTLFFFECVHPFSTLFFFFSLM